MFRDNETNGVILRGWQAAAAGPQGAEGWRREEGGGSKAEDGRRTEIKKKDSVEFGVRNTVSVRGKRGRVPSPTPSQDLRIRNRS